MTGILQIEKSGNIFSLIQAVNSLKIDFKIIKSLNDFDECNRIVIPGVGSFNNSMNFLNSNFNIDELVSVLKSKKILGICVGMQIFAEYGCENEKTKGLNLINGQVKKIKTNKVLPHVGFNLIDIHKQSLLFNDINENQNKFYFTHSFELINNDNITSSCNFFGKKIITSIQRDNIYGVQFHPENSRDQGVKILENFLK